MCKRPIFADSTECFHIFLAEVGVGVFVSLTRSLRNEFANVTNKRSSLLILHFRNAAIVPIADENDQERPLLTYQQSYRAISVLMIYAAPGTAAKRIAQTCSRKIVGDQLN
jgi:hypothetical protein